MSTAPLLIGAPTAGGEDVISRFLGVATGSQPVPRPEGEAQSPEDQRLTSFVTSLRQRSESTMATQRQRWAMTDAMIADSQWVAVDQYTGRLVTPPAPRGKPRVQANMMKKWAVSAEARLQSAHPKIIVKAGSSDDRVIQASRLTTKVVGEYEWQKCRMDKVLSEFIPGLYRHGDAALKVEWNPRGGQKLPPKPKPLRIDGQRIQAQGPQPVMDPMGQPVLDEFGQPLTEVGPLFEEDGVTPVWEAEIDPMTGQPVMLEEWTGANETYYISASDIFWDEAATRPEDAMWVLISTGRSPAWVYDRYQVEVTAAAHSRTMEMQRFNRNLNLSNTPQTVQVDELWIRRGRYRFGPNVNDVIEFETGFVVIVAGNRVLDKGPNPYAHGEFPICFERAILTDKQMRGDTPVNSMRELQTAINKTLSAGAHSFDLMSDHQWLIPTTCKMPEADKRNGPGVYKRYTPDPSFPTLKPEKVEGSPLPGGFAELIMLFKDSFGSDISMQHVGGLAGGVPPQVEAGVTMEAIVERDTTPMTPIALAIGRTLERWAYLVAKNWQQFVPEKRTVDIFGQWHETATFEFAGTDIYDCFEYTVVQASVMPQSKAAEFQKSLALSQTFPDKFGWREFAQRTGEDQSEVMSQAQRQAANARRENYLFQTVGMIDTTPEEIRFVDDPAIHVEEHMCQLLDRQWARENPAAWQALVIHTFQQHMPILQMQQMQAMAAQAGVAPSGPGQPGPSQGPPAGPGDQPLSVPRPGILANA